MVQSSLGVCLGRVSSGEPWIQGRLWEKRHAMSFVLENLNLFLFHPFSFCKQHTHTHTRTHAHTHTHTHKDIFRIPLSFSVFLSIFRKRKTHTRMRTKELSGNVLFSFFLWYSPLSSALTFIICLFVCFCFCFAKAIFCSCIAITKAIMQNKINTKNYSKQKKRLCVKWLGVINIT